MCGALKSTFVLARHVCVWCVCVCDMECEHKTDEIARFSGEGAAGSPCPLISQISLAATSHWHRVQLSVCQQKLITKQLARIKKKLLTHFAKQQKYLKNLKQVRKILQISIYYYFSSSLIVQFAKEISGKSFRFEWKNLCNILFLKATSW